MKCCCSCGSGLSFINKIFCENFVKLHSLFDALEIGTQSILKINLPSCQRRVCVQAESAIWNRPFYSSISMDPTALGGGEGIRSNMYASNSVWSFAKLVPFNYPRFPPVFFKDNLTNDIRTKLRHSNLFPRVIQVLPFPRTINRAIPTTPRPGLSILWCLPSRHSSLLPFPRVPSSSQPSCANIRRSERHWDHSQSPTQHALHDEMIRPGDGVTGHFLCI